MKVGIVAGVPPAANLGRLTELPLILATSEGWTSLVSRGVRPKVVFLGEGEPLPVLAETLGAQAVKAGASPMAAMMRAAWEAGAASVLLAVPLASSTVETMDRLRLLQLADSMGLQAELWDGLERWSLLHEGREITVAQPSHCLNLVGIWGPATVQLGNGEGEPVQLALGSPLMVGRRTTAGGPVRAKVLEGTCLAVEELDPEREA